MSSLAACFKTHDTPKEAQADIREMVQDHKDNGSTNPALDALNDMIQIAEAKRPDLVAKLEAAGGKAPELNLPSYTNSATIEGEKSPTNNEVTNGTLATGYEEGTLEGDRNGTEGNIAESIPSHQGSGEVSTGVPGPTGTSLDLGVSSSNSGDGRGSKESEPVTTGTGTDNNDANTDDLGNSNGKSPRVPGKSVHARDFRVLAGGIKREGSWKKTAERNLDIIELAKKLEEEKRPATAKEQELLSLYTGFGASEIANNLFPGYARTGKINPSIARDESWGKLAERLNDLLTKDEIRTAAKSTQYAHYTSEAIINSIYNALGRFGFKGGKVLEPGAGVSSFWGLMPKSMHKNSRYTGIEMDHVTALIAKHLYPEQSILNADFTKQNLPANFFDLAIGNPPFSDTKITSDPAYKKNKFLLHDYFFAKSLDKVRPGGLLVFVTSKGTMDKGGDAARQYIAERADLLGAIRLPQTAFKQHSGTEVVTDILFLRKRDEGQKAKGEAWLGREEVKTEEGPALINEYFSSHPEMVLGTNSLQGSMYGANEYTVLPHEGNIEEHFAQAIENLPKSVYKKPKAKRKAKATIKPDETVEFEFNPDNKKEGGIYLNKSGKLMRVTSGAGKTVTPLDGLSVKQIAWLKDYVPLRDAVKKAQHDQLTDGDWEKSLKALNKEYDKFVKKHGAVLANTVTEKTGKNADGDEVLTISKRYKNKKVMGYDADSPAVRALEKEDDNGKVSKGPFLTGRSIQKPERKKPENIADAMALSLDLHGTLDIEDIAQSLDVSEQEAIDGLGDLIYKNPDTAEYEPRDGYLSGDVKAKLEVAKAAAKVDNQYERNVKALEASQPAPLKASDVTIKLGSPWVDTKIVEKFAFQVLGVALKLEYSAVTNYFKLKMAGYDKPQAGRGEASEWSTQKRSAFELLDSVLNNRTIKILNYDSKGKSSPDVTGTVAANEIADKMRQRFSSWVWEDAKRAGELLDQYNEKYNNLAGREFDGSHLTLPGVSMRFKLHPHQKNAIWRIIQTGNTYVGHAVGAGKTMVMIAAGMEMKRLGMVQKPIYVVPKHMLAQFSNEFLELYPMAQVMVADEENFHTDNRRNFIAQAALNSPDAIIITHPSLKKLGMQQANIDVVADQMISDLRESMEEMEEDDKTGNRFLIKKIEKRIEKLEQMFAGMVSSDKDQSMTFEEIGADFMFVDEAHEFRKLDFATNRQAKGIDSNGSQQAIDLFIKTKWLGTQNPGRSHVFASGTPVTNTMGELFNLMRFFIDEEMGNDGIRHFDAWASMFGEVAPDFERNAAGNYAIVERFAKFVNVPELMKRVRSFMDVLTFTDLGAFVKRPDVKGGMPEMVIAPQSEELSKYLKGELTKRLEVSAAWKPTKEQPGNPDPVINIITDGRLASIDMRFMNPRSPDNKNSKLNKMVDGIISTWNDTKDHTYVDRHTGEIQENKGSAQIVFFNLGFGDQVKLRGFDARSWMMKRLKEAGIPESEIGWMADANNAAKKERLFSEMRSGTKRIMIGSAKQMGTGVNVQDRLHTLHYMDAPWYPADVEQPMGRIIRQGNQNEEISAYWYATEGSYDSTMWQMVARKSKFTEQAFSGDDSVRTLEDISTSSQYEMATAISSGDSRVIQLAGLKNEIERLSRLKVAHQSNQRTMAYNQRDAVHQLGYHKDRLKHLEEADKKVGGYVRDWSGSINGKTSFEKRADLGAAIQTKMEEFDEVSKKLKLGDAAKRDVGTFNGYPMVAVIGSIHTELQVVITKQVKMTVDYDGDSGGLVTRLVNLLNSVSTKKRETESAIEKYKAEIDKYETRIGAPYEHSRELNEKIAEAQQLQNDLVSEGGGSDSTTVPSDGILVSLDEGLRIEQGKNPMSAVKAPTPNRVANKRNMLSVGLDQVTNPANIEEELRNELGDNLDTLLDSGKVVISDQAKTAGKKSQKGKVQGFTKSNNAVTLIQGNIEAGSSWPVLLHELGVHAGQLLMSNKEFQSILESLEKRKNEDSATGKAIRAAYARVPKKTKPEHVLEEVLAYMVENNPKTTLVRRVIALIKRVLLKFGFKPDIMNNEDFTALAVIAVKRQAKGAGYDKAINGRSEGEEAPGNKGRVSKLRREVGRMGEGGRGSSTNDSTRFSKLAKGEEPRAFTKDDLDSDEFKEFFGDSKILDDYGKPLEVFFGSESFGTEDSSDYWTFGAREGRTTNSPEAGLGQYFTTDKTEAMGYTRGTGNVKGFYLRLERPLKIHSSKLPHFTGKAEAAAWAKRKKELDGHDGLVLTDRDHIVIFDKNQAKSSEVTTGEFSRDDDDTRYSVAAEPLTTEFLEETAGSITYHKNEKIDSNFLDRIFSTPEYYFKKFAAAGRVLQAALLRRDIRYTKETEILGDFVKYIQKLRKTNTTAYKEANDYLINTDQEVDGFTIKSSKDDDSWKVIAPLWAVNGDKNKQLIGTFTDETEAVTVMIKAEAMALQEEGFSKEAITAIMKARELTNRGFDVMAEDMRKIIREAKENGQPDPFIGDGKLNEAGRYGVYAAGQSKPIALFASQRAAEEKMAEAAEAISYIIVGGNGKLKNFKNQMRAKAYAKKHSGTVEGQKIFGNLTVKRRSDSDMRPLTVKEALAQMGDLRGIYFPRIRESGEYVLIARKDGENPIRKHFDLPAAGDNNPTIQSLLNSVTPMGREAKRLKLKGYTVTVKKDDSPAEDVFEATNLVTSLDAILQGSLATVNKNDSDDVKAGQHINQILTMQVADIFKSRGYLSSRIKRLAGDEIWEGYEEDMGKALTQYGKNVAAGTAKRDTARAMVLAFSGRDYSWAEYKEEVDKPDYAEYEKIVEKRRISERSQKNLFRDVRSFMIDILRNDEQADRIMGTFKGLAVLKYLGFRVSSATVNMTNMVQGVPATIAGHTGESLKDSVGRVIAAATVYGKYRSGKGSVSQADRDIFEYISKKGWDEAQFNHEAASELRGKLGEKWNKFMTASMFMFGAAEKANRAMTLFAAYKAVKEKNTNMSEPLVWEKAKEISDRAHGIYGKETIPAWARGKYNILRLTYTFQKFSHNYMLNMIDLGFTKKEYKAAAYMLLSPALLAGSSASLAGPALFALAGALGIGGDDPEEEFYKWAEDTFGGETFARHGIFGALAGINIKGSLQMNNPMPTNLKELAGPVGGILGDTVKGFEHLFKGELAKGAESLLPTAFGSFSKATREATEGITTGNYGSVFYGDEPLRADAADAFIRFLSFNPSRLSGIREKQWHERKVKADYQADKTAIYAKIKRLNLKGMSITPELYKEIYAYNYRVSSSGRRDLSRITGSSIRTMLKRNQKASKLERERAVN